MPRETDVADILTTTERKFMYDLVKTKALDQYNKKHGTKLTINKVGIVTNNDS